MARIPEPGALDALAIAEAAKPIGAWRIERFLPKVAEKCNGNCARSLRVGWQARARPRSRAPRMASRRWSIASFTSTEFRQGAVARSTSPACTACRFGTPNCPRWTRQHRSRPGRSCDIANAAAGALVMTNADPERAVVDEWYRAMDVDRTLPIVAATPIPTPLDLIKLRRHSRGASRRLVPVGSG